MKSCLLSLTASFMTWQPAQPVSFTLTPKRALHHKQTGVEETLDTCSYETINLNFLYSSGAPCYCTAKSYTFTVVLWFRLVILSLKLFQEMFFLCVSLYVIMVPGGPTYVAFQKKTFSCLLLVKLKHFICFLSHFMALNETRLHSFLRTICE